MKAQKIKQDTDAVERTKLRSSSDIESHPANVKLMLASETGWVIWHEEEVLGNVYPFSTQQPLHCNQRVWRAICSLESSTVY